MNKFSIIIFIVIIALFGIIIFVTQSGSNSKSANQFPTFSPDANTFQVISPSSQQTQGQSTDITKVAPNPTFGVEEGVQASYSAVIKTTKGDIEVYLSGRDAPRTVKNFLEKAKSGFYKNLKFHRVEEWVIQGGDPKGDGTGGGAMITEINALPFVVGSLGVARSNVNNDSQFFIVKRDAFWLNQQYTNFGIVTKGMDIVNQVNVGDKILGITIE